MFALWISMFMLYIQNYICVFNSFLFGGAFYGIIRTRLITATLSQPRSSTQRIHLRGLFISRENVWLH